MASYLLEYSQVTIMCLHLIRSFVLHSLSCVAGLNIEMRSLMPYNQDPEFSRFDWKQGISFNLMICCSITSYTWIILITCSCVAFLATLPVMCSLFACTHSQRSKTGWHQARFKSVVSNRHAAFWSGFPPGRLQKLYYCETWFVWWSLLPSACSPGEWEVGPCIQCR